ncbi:polyphosphate--glucose phosphotransferase [Lysinibacter cavernae]|uniref:Polyphosphate glucokinase n=1 Tax=Lysinibacter cavernae TaxID=1640652 RepID=A0A7X5QZG8_9MICO|nr:ROK family protein [Lysinibacter cavernae]NIH52637.1 polyphosphate glucokinase [Lysinibacter cavernae]
MASQHNGEQQTAEQLYAEQYPTEHQYAVGIDIGGTGIKGALVDVFTGELVSDRFKIATPEGGEPEDIAATVHEIVGMIPDVSPETPVGVAFPAIAKYGKTLSASNVSKRWIGLEAAELFSTTLGRPITFANDADAAGLAEVRYGAAHNHQGLVFVTTLGTGIGTALIYKGILVPNLEFGHLQYNGDSIERYAANSVREREGLDYPEWAERLQVFFDQIEALFTPDLFIVGGGVSKSHEKFLPLLKLNTPIVPAELRNNAGIMGAAALAVS